MKDKKEIIFTICSKNYFAQAKVLASTVKKFAPHVDFTVLLADEIRGENLNEGDVKVVEAITLGIPGYLDMAFKYDVIEFNTSIKPFYFEKLFQQGYSKVLYLDPDMALYDSIEFLFETLDSYDIILTPHLLKPYLDYEGSTSEEELLFVGIYNLGFVAISNSSVGNHIVEWWKRRLKDQCFADKEDALHVDQKWMDFIPSLYTDHVKILRHPGVNLAFWNMHERSFIDTGSAYVVDDQPLVIYHFSGLNPNDYECIAAKQSKKVKTLSDVPQFRRLYEEYVHKLIKSDYPSLHVLPYTYNFFSNGIYIAKYQRRLYRGLQNDNLSFDNPFQLGSGSYYELLDANKLLVKSRTVDSVKKTYGGKIQSKLNIIFKLLKVVRLLVGTEKYVLLCKFMGVYYRFEKQSFLFKGNKR